MFIATKKVITSAALEDIALVKNARGHMRYWKEKEECYSEFVIKEHFANCDELINDEELLVASYLPVKQTRLDQKALAEDHPDIYKKYCIQTEHRRFTIKL